MNTFKGKRISGRCSKVGMALVLSFLVGAPQYGAAKEMQSVKDVDALMMPAEVKNAEPVYYFVASLTDGTVLSIPFSERPELTCQGVDLLLKTTEMEMELPHGSVKEFTLDRKEVTTAVEDVRQSGEMERNGDIFHFSNCRAGSSVTVYDRSGRRVVSQRVDENGQCQISLLGQPSGVYVIKSESITCKILKK